MRVKHTIIIRKGVVVMSFTEKLAEFWKKNPFFFRVVPGLLLILVVFLGRIGDVAVAVAVILLLFHIGQSKEITDELDQGTHNMVDKIFRRESKNVDKEFDSFAQDKTHGESANHSVQAGGAYVNKKEDNDTVLPDEPNKVETSVTTDEVEEKVIVIPSIDDKVIDSNEEVLSTNDEVVIEDGAVDSTPTVTITESELNDEVEAVDESTALSDEAEYHTITQEAEDEIEAYEETEQLATEEESLNENFGSPEEEFDLSNPEDTAVGNADLDVEAAKSAVEVDSQTDSSDLDGEVNGAISSEAIELGTEAEFNQASDVKIADEEVNFEDEILVEHVDESPEEEATSEWYEEEEEAILVTDNVVELESDDFDELAEDLSQAKNDMEEASEELDATIHEVDDIQIDEVIENSETQANNWVDEQNVHQETLLEELKDKAEDLTQN